MKPLYLMRNSNGSVFFLQNLFFALRNLREGPPQDPPTSPGKKILIFGSNILNERSHLTIVKPKILNHLVSPVRNAGQNTE